MVTVIGVDTEGRCITIHFAGERGGFIGMLPIHLFPSDVKEGDEVELTVAIP